MLAILGTSFLALTAPVAAQRSVIPSSHPRITNSNGSSENWSGYAVTGPTGSVTDVQGSWIAPSVSCSSTNAYAAFWVGIDGYSSTTVEQTGTMAECQGGTASYYAWYEFYPSASYSIPSVPVAPGNVISADVVYSGGAFTTTITDVTTGKTYSTSQAVASAQESSAEWIAEAPSSGNSILALANFGTAYYGDDNTGVASTNYATVSGVTGTISSFGSAVQDITMVSGSGSVEATPSAVSSDGTSFSVAWGSSTTTTSSSSSTTTTTTTTTTTSSTSTSTTSPSQLVVSVTTNRASYSPGSTVTINVLVTTSTGAPVSRASVTVTLTTPNGGEATGRGTTDRDGSVSFIYSTARNTPAGTYTLGATASASGYASGAGSTTFQIT